MKRAIAFVAVMCSLAASPNRETAYRAFPSVMMIRGGGLTETIVLQHTFGADPESFRKDPIVILYSAMAQTDERSAVPSPLKTYSVALFWGPQWVRQFGKDNRPIAGLSFAQGSQFGELFVSSGKIQWVPATGIPLRPGEHPSPAVVLTDDAVKVLVDAGMPKN